MARDSLRKLSAEITACRACPRLVAWREQVAAQKVARFRHCDYWGRPVSGFGDPRARLLLVGLAPGAHGANRTGRMFTGDRSGDFLYAALYRAGVASQPTSVDRGDGLSLRGVYISGAVRCAPPGNAPAPDEIARCAPFLDREIAQLGEVRAVLALGAIAWRACLGHLRRAGVVVSRPSPPFAHGVSLDLRAEPRAAPWQRLLGSYHVSQQNTQTGKLTPAMFDEALREALSTAGGARAYTGPHTLLSPLLSPPPRRSSRSLRTLKPR